MTSEISTASLRDTVSQFLTPIAISKIATGIGFDTDANFSPNEYASFLKTTTKIVLERLSKNDFHYQNLSDMQTRQVISIVDETLCKECKILPYDPSFLDFPACVHDFYASITLYLFPISDL